jgi:hypothetical protein
MPDSKKNYYVLLKTTDGGKTWKRIITPQYIVGIQGMDMLDSNNIVCFSSFGKIIKTTDGGDNWYCDSTLDYFDSHYSYGELGRYITSRRIIVGSAYYSKVLLWDEDGFPNDVQEEIPGNNQLTISPNPASAYCNIKINIPEPCTINIELLNTYGQSVIPAKTSEVFETSEVFKTQLDLSGLAPGVYIVLLGTGKERYVQKFVKVD